MRSDSVTRHASFSPKLPLASGTLSSLSRPRRIGILRGKRRNTQCCFSIIHLSGGPVSLVWRGKLTMRFSDRRVPQSRQEHVNKCQESMILSHASKIPPSTCTAGIRISTHVNDGFGTRSHHDAQKQAFSQCVSCRLYQPVSCSVFWSVSPFLLRLTQTCWIRSFGRRRKCTHILHTSFSHVLTTLLTVLVFTLSLRRIRQGDILSMKLGRSPMKLGKRVAAWRQR